jgi:integrase
MKNGGKLVWASARNLRRTFAARWSRRVNSMVLKELMRHASVTTTEKYYVGIQSDETSALPASLMSNKPAEGEHSPKR